MVIFNGNAISRLEVIKIVVQLYPDSNLEGIESLDQLLIILMLQGLGANAMLLKKLRGYCLFIDLQTFARSQVISQHVQNFAVPAQTLSLTISLS